jgi:hypothetical protein
MKIKWYANLFFQDKLEHLWLEGLSKLFQYLRPLQCFTQLFHSRHASFTNIRLDLKSFFHAVKVRPILYGSKCYKTFFL